MVELLKAWKFVQVKIPIQSSCICFANKSEHLAYVFISRMNVFTFIRDVQAA